MLRIRHFIAALLLHVAFLAFVLVGIYFHPVVRPLPVIEAVLISAKQPQKVEAKVEPEAEPQPETPSREKPKPQAIKQEQKDKKEQEKKAELQRKAELQKKADWVKKRAEDELKLKKLEEQERQHQMEQEEKRLTEDKLKREQEAERRRQQELHAMLDQEKQGRMASERDKWGALIQDKVRRNWVRPVNSIDKFQCKVDVQILPGGTVVNVKLAGSCGSSVLDESVKRAVWKSDPLPMPADPNVFDRNLNFTFIPGTN